MKRQRTYSYLVLGLMAGVLLTPGAGLAAPEMTPRKAIYYHAQAGNMRALRAMKNSGYGIPRTVPQTTQGRNLSNRASGGKAIAGSGIAPRTITATGLTIGGLALLGGGIALAAGGGGGGGGC